MLSACHVVEEGERQGVGVRNNLLKFESKEVRL